MGRDHRPDSCWGLGLVDGPWGEVPDASTNSGVTSKAQAIVDQMLPVVHATSTEAFAHLSEVEREQLIAMLTTVRTQLAAVASLPPATPKPRGRPPFR